MRQEDAIASLDGEGPSYRGAGVDIDAGKAFVESIKPLTRATARPGAAGDLGGFGGFFDLKAAGFRDPLLVAATDGVGTKVLLAIQAGRHQDLGIDLVAMCVNDLVVQGAEPLVFLDYLACARLEIDRARAVVAGIAEGCRQAGCALIGGETAEMPGLYGAGDYDLAGFAVGAVEREAALTGATVRPGDLVLGLASSGLHSNGFSLVRQLVAELGAALEAPAPFAPEASLAEALLTPTRIYVRSCLGAIRGGGVEALAHITGGGLVENLPRVLPEETAAILDLAAWRAPRVFHWLKESGGVAEEEMLRTFNCGIGMAVICRAERAAEVAAALENGGERVYEIGRIVARGSGEPQLRLDNRKALWRR